MGTETHWNSALQKPHNMFLQLQHDQNQHPSGNCMRVWESIILETSPFFSTKGSIQLYRLCLLPTEGPASDKGVTLTASNAAEGDNEIARLHCIWVTPRMGPPEGSNPYLAFHSLLDDGGHAGPIGAPQTHILLRVSVGSWTSYW